MPADREGRRHVPDGRVPGVRRGDEHSRRASDPLRAGLLAAVACQRAVRHRDRLWQPGRAARVDVVAEGAGRWRRGRCRERSVADEDVLECERLAAAAIERAGETGEARTNTAPKPGRAGRNYPVVVTTYRGNYGAVDSFDRLRAEYTSHQPTNRSLKCLWFWSLDSMAINSYLLAKMDNAPYTDDYLTFLTWLILNWAGLKPGTEQAAVAASTAASRAADPGSSNGSSNVGVRGHGHGHQRR